VKFETAAVAILDVFAHVSVTSKDIRIAFIVQKILAIQESLRPNITLMMNFRMTAATIL